MGHRDDFHPWHGQLRLPARQADPPGFGMLPSLETWKWLEELRYRFDSPFEVLSVELEFMLPPPPDTPHGLELRNVLLTSPLVRESATAVLRTARARSLSAGGLRLSIVPLLGGTTVPRTVVAALAIADPLPPSAPGADRVEDSDRRLGSTGLWLAAAIETTIKATGADRAESRDQQRLASMIDVIQALGELDDERQFIRLMVDALAIWFDADVRAYRQEAGGGFALSMVLPGADPTAAPATLPADELWDRDEVTSLQSLERLEALAPGIRLADTLLMPIRIDDSPEWILMVSGSNDPSLESMLNFFGRSAGPLLTRREYELIKRIERRMTTFLTAGDAPFDATVRLALEAAGRELGATSARLAVYYRGQRTPAAVVGWGRADQVPPVFVEPGILRSLPHEVTVSVTAGAGVTALIELHRLDTAFSTAAARVAPIAASLMGAWLAGVFLAPAEGRAQPERHAALTLADRLQNDVDDHGRLRTGGAVAVIQIDMPAPLAPYLEEVMQALRLQVRPGDAIGVLADDTAAVLLAELEPSAAPLVVERLSRATRERISVPIRIGAAIIDTASDSPSTVLDRATANARRGAASD